MIAYYNDNDPYCVAWLDNLIDAGLITTGYVDPRSVVDVSLRRLDGPLSSEFDVDLSKFTRCHFFAGIGGWDYALQLAGWGDSPVWTASLPCQPFSVAGKRKRESDERHLWPDFRRLIATFLPNIIFGEQVVSKDGREWLSEVRFDLEHIYYWTAFYENLYEVQTAKTLGCVPEILRAICRRVETVVQDVSAEIREEMANSPPEAASCSKAKTDRKRAGVPSRVQQNVLDRNHDSQPEKEEPSKRLGLRLGQAHSVVEETFRKNDVRNDRHPVEFRDSPDEIRQSVDRQDSSGEGVCDFQRSDRLLRNERGAWNVGGRQTPHVNASVAEVINNDIRAIAEQFRTEIKRSVERLQLSGVRTELEALGYAVGAADLCAAGAGAPHIRPRLYWLAHSPVAEVRTGQSRMDASPWDSCATITGYNGELLRIQPGLEPLVDGVSFRLADGRTRSDVSRMDVTHGIGNSIVPQVAAEFIRAYMDVQRGINWQRDIIRNTNAVY